MQQPDMKGTIGKGTIDKGTINKGTIGAVLLAAGESKRFVDGNKLLQPLNGKPLLFHALESLQASNVDKIVVVVQPDDNALITRLQTELNSDELNIIGNKQFHSGMASSIRAGIAHCSEHFATLICLGDMPHVAPQVINQLIEAARKERSADIVVPVGAAGRGNPKLFKCTQFKHLAQLRGDAGARALLRQHPDRVTEVAIDDGGIYKDYDVESDFFESD